MAPGKRQHNRNRSGRGRWSIRTCDWYRSPDWGWGCNHFVAYSFNGNDNCWLCQETEEELQALQVKQVKQVKQVNRRTWRRSTEAIKSSFVTRMRCSKMPTHAKDKVLHETKNKSKAKIILMVKKCSGSCWRREEEKQWRKRSLLSLPASSQLELFTFSFYSFLRGCSGPLGRGHS